MPSRKDKEKVPVLLLSSLWLRSGPLAWSEAGKVQGLQVNEQKGEVSISNGDPKAAVDRLVAQYERLFGRASHEVCIEAAASMISSLPKSDVPASLLA